MRTPVRRYRTIGLFIILAGAWGSAFMAIKAGLPYIPPVLFAALRYDIAGILMLGYALAQTDQPVPQTQSGWASVGAGATLIFAGYHALLFIGETDPAVTSAAAAVIVSLSPMLTTGFARVFLPTERLTLVGFLAWSLVSLALLCSHRQICRTLLLAGLLRSYSSSPLQLHSHLAQC
jgi:EamA-like transporter family.